MKNFITTTLILLFICSCSSPLDKKYNEATAKEDIKEIKTEIDSTDLMLMAQAMFRLKLQDQNLESMTYADILENGRDFKEKQDIKEAEQKALAAAAEKIEAERVERLNKSVLVTCFEKGYMKADYEDYITYKFAIQNKTNKAIRALKGEIVFNDLFDEKISALGFTYDQTIAADETVNWDASTDYNQFKDSDQKLRNKDLKDIKVVWKPEKIIFEDGSTLE